VRSQVVSQLHSSVLICSVTLKTIPDVLIICTDCIFRNATNGTISQAISTKPDGLVHLYIVWWPGCQPASANNRLRGIQRLAPFRITWAMHTELRIPIQLMNVAEDEVCHMRV